MSCTSTNPNQLLPEQLTIKSRFDFLNIVYEIIIVKGFSETYLPVFAVPDTSSSQKQQHPTARLTAEWGINFEYP